MKPTAFREYLRQEFNKETNIAPVFANRSPYIEYIDWLEENLNKAMQEYAAKSSEERPNIKDYFPEATNLQDVIGVYSAAPYLFKYAQALDFYIDEITSQQPKVSDKEIEEWVKEHGYYGTCTSEYHEGLEEGAKWMRDKYI